MGKTHTQMSKKVNYPGKGQSAMRAVYGSIHSQYKVGPGSWIDANWAYQERYSPCSHISEPGGEEISIWVMLEMHIYKEIIEGQRSVETKKCFFDWYVYNSQERE